jgi:hypothetical protein
VALVQKPDQQTNTNDNACRSTNDDLLFFVFVTQVIAPYLALCNFLFIRHSGESGNPAMNYVMDSRLRGNDKHKVNGFSRDHHV